MATQSILRTVSHTAFWKITTLGFFEPKLEVDSKGMRNIKKGLLFLHLAGFTSAQNNAVIVKPSKNLTCG